MIYFSNQFFYIPQPQFTQIQNQHRIEQYDQAFYNKINFYKDGGFNSQKNNLSLLNNQKSMFFQKINQIYSKTNQINDMLNTLQKNILLMEQQLNQVDQVIETQDKEESAQTNTNSLEILPKRHTSGVSSNRTHPKIKLMQKIFGKHEYCYKLAFDGKFPKYLYKQRNISLKILLKNISGQTVINGNQLSLNLKVYKNNGEEIFLDRQDTHFMNGVCLSSMYNGIGHFSKIHPKQVSRNFSQKGLCIIIYATSQPNAILSKGSIIKASEVQPLIFYNVKVVVKQQKLLNKNNIQNDQSQVN